MSCRPVMKSTPKEVSRNYAVIASEDHHSLHNTSATNACTSESLLLTAADSGLSGDKVTTAQASHEYACPMLTVQHHSEPAAATGCMQQPAHVCTSLGRADRSACREMPAEAASEMIATSLVPARNSSRSCTLIMSMMAPAATPLAFLASHLTRSLSFCRTRRPFLPAQPRAMSDSCTAACFGPWPGHAELGWSNLQRLGGSYAATT